VAGLLADDLHAVRLDSCAGHQSQTAKMLGLTVPLTLQASADEVIE
jgi:hypothetical protein